MGEWIIPEEKDLDEDDIRYLKEHGAVKLVRCKDCRKNMMCEITLDKPRNWFCADGEWAYEPEEKTKYYTVTHCPNCGRPFTENMVCECGQNNAAIRL